MSLHDRLAAVLARDHPGPTPHLSDIRTVLERG